jgi:hypothetical protein
MFTNASEEPDVSIFMAETTPKMYVMPYSIVDIYQHFGGTRCFHLHGRDYAENVCDAM